MKLKGFFRILQVLFRTNPGNSSRIGNSSCYGVNYNMINDQMLTLQECSLPTEVKTFGEIKQSSGSLRTFKMGRQSMTEELM